MTNVIIAQDSVNVNDIPCVRICKEKKTAESFTAMEILTGSNELAADILKMNGFKSLDSDGFAEIHKPMEFYGVSLLYYTNLLDRYNICLKHYPSDVIRKYDKKYGETYLSARVILALCMLMQQGRNIPKDSKVKEIYLRLCDTSYYERGWNLAQDEKRKDKRLEDAKRKAESAIREGLLDDGELPEITPEGKILITVGGLAKLVGMMNTASSYKNSNEDIVQGSQSIEQGSPKDEGNLTGVPNTVERNSLGRAIRIPVIATKDEVVTRYKSMNQCAKAIGSSSTAVSKAVRRPDMMINGYKITLA